ncbi:MAG: hypothetical protein EXR98_01860 [Gemmataceae bacterium]|nr:hypothetical protein [Gemmataceae bacterium]
MNPILKRLASLRLKVRLLDGWQGVSALVGLVFGVGLLVGTLDFYTHLPSLVRAVLLVGLLVGSGIVAYRYLIRPFAKPCDDLSLALRIEEEYPELNDALASTVQFLTQGPEEQERLGGSEALRQKTMKETIDKAARFDFARILDRRAAALFGAGAFCALLLAGLVAWKTPSYSQIAFWRFVEPFGEHTWTRISVAKKAPLDLVDQQGDDSGWAKLDPRSRKGDVIAKGRPYSIRVNLKGQIPKNARVEIDGQIRTDQTYEIKRSQDGESGSFEARIDMTQQYGNFRFRVLANDGAFPPRAGSWHLVEVLPPPTLVKLNGLPSPQLAVYPPAYTDLSPSVLEPGTRHLNLTAGSHVVLRAKASRPLEQAWIEYRPEGALIAPASVLTLLGQTNPLQAVAQVVGGSAVWGKVPARFEADRSVFQIDFTPWITGSYTLHLRDKDKLESSPDVADLKVNLDPLPMIKLLQPGSSATALPTADVAFKFLVTDELFAIKRVYVEYRKKGADGQPWETLDRVPLYEALDHGKLVPIFVSQLTGAARPAADLRLRYKKLEFGVVWSLRTQDFRNGDIISVEICAEDFCDIYPTREPGRSQAIELRIIGKQDLTSKIENQLAEIAKKIQAIEKIQHNAQDAVKDTRKEDKIDQRVRDNFIEKGVQQQREVRDHIGQDAKEGLRRDVGEIKRTLEENRLTGTQAYREATKIKGTLDAIAQQELQEIEPKLAEANADLAQNDKNPDKTKANLEQIAKRQQSVRDALNGLIKDINPQAKMQGLKQEVQDLIGKQEEIRQKLEELNNLKRVLDEDPQLTPEKRKTNENILRDQINEQRKDQQELENKMNKLLQEMKAAKQTFEKEDDHANAKKVEQAIQQAEPKFDPKQPDKKPITQQMKNVAEQLDGKTETPQKTLQQQERIQKNLEEVAKALEGRSEDATKQDIQDRKDTEKELDKITKKIEQLRNEAKKIDKIENKEERLKAKEELAKKHAELQDEINKMRHQLARLNEQRAADALNEAAKDLEKAGNDIKDGANPDQAQKEAKEKVQRAKQELQDAEEELARELLIKIHDQLEAIKIREIGSIERSENLHAKIMKKKIWTDAFLDTIEGNMEAQKGIAEETDVFKDKLKEAKVFHSLLEKAKEAMDKAVKVMDTRREEGLNRRENKFDDMELKDENEWHADTVKHQKVALQKIERLLDALKDEIKKPKKQLAQKDPMGDDEPKESQGGMQDRDGIPPTAQLKVLRAEQVDLNQKTEDFAKRNPDLTKLTEEQQRELAELSQEQERIHDLFRGLFPPQQPMPKEGDPK